MKIKEINFGSAIKLGKTLTMSWHDVRSEIGDRWEVTLEGDEFCFKDKKGEFPSTYTTKANVKFWLTEKPVKQTETTKPVAAARGK